MAIDTEIKTLSADEAGGADTKYAGTQWKSQFGAVVVFSENGQFSETGPDVKFTGTWNAVNDSEVRVRRSDNTTWHFQLQTDGETLVRKENRQAVWRRVP